MLLCAHQELFPLTHCIEGRVEKKQAYRCVLSTPCMPFHACVQRAIQIEAHTCTHTYMHTLIHTQTHTETLSPEQWQATAQDVYVTSRVCEKLFGVAVETKRNIEKSQLSVHSSLSVEKSQSIRESQASSPTLAAAARLSAMIHGKDQVYANAMLVDQVSCSSFSIQCH